ncbi:uncharacterized protein PHALS_05507 [Plasmopara halstedii]|uniref:Uncharacterized protein n=1 Tax=Plasmopara halstedii TaxID=4781 RepID=A0A0P1B1Q7_PLAHL|nr:uncharacterized protein PHALS_05507 [Plasmopara halstedii]CEG48028.1 hypothetical protein PHALS_05507 [Plasmopara halstedii]|eukprot:XP_024584397.1 hypothetical protein PHALS_05507 [Plasmopara halstedii]
MYSNFLAQMGPELANANKATLKGFTARLEKALDLKKMNDRIIKSPSAKANPKKKIDRINDVPSASANKLNLYYQLNLYTALMLRRKWGTQGIDAAKWKVHVIELI